MLVGISGYRQRAIFEVFHMGLGYIITAVLDCCLCVWSTLCCESMCLLILKHF